MNRIRCLNLLTAMRISNPPLLDRLVWILQDDLYARLKVSLGVRTKREVASALGGQLLARLRSEAVAHFEIALGPDGFARIIDQVPPWHWKRCAEVLLLDGEQALADRSRVKRCRCGCWIEEAEQCCVFCGNPHPRGPWTSAYKVEMIEVDSLDALLSPKIQDEGDDEEEAEPGMEEGGEMEIQQ